MSKSYSSSGRRDDSLRRDAKGYAQLHPIWRGVGCILFVAIVIASWFVAEYIRVLHFHNQYKWGVPYLYGINRYVYDAVLALAISFVIFGIIVVLYGWVARPQIGDPLTVRGRSRRKPRKSR